MIIDRNNYEEMFILYWDNELDAVQKQAVEDFVAANADLREEFTLLGSTRFSPEEKISFPSKELLFQQDSLIDQNNYEEYLLSYVDGEVNQNERAEIEKFLKSNPDVQTHLVLLQSTKLHPEKHIVFPDKSILYRKEEKTFRMIWIRVAAAAVIVLLAGVYTFNLLDSTKVDQKNETIAKVNTEQSAEPIQKKEIPSNNNDKEATLDKDQIASSELTNVNTQGKEKTNERKKDKEVLASNTATINKENKEIITNSTNVNSESDVVLKPLTEDVSVSTFINASNQNIDPNKSLIAQAVTVRTSPSLNDIETPESDKENGGGVKGLLRKATRVFERRTNIKATTDDDKLLVGAFAVSLK